VTVVTAVVFSATLAVAPLVIDGASLTLVTVTAIACVARERPVGDLHLHVVDVVRVRVGRRLVVRRRDEAQRPGARVDREARRVGAADDRVVNVVPASGSLAVTVVTAVVFSATLTAAPLVIDGASLTFGDRHRDRLRRAVSDPSDTCTCTS
jgi:hypothetical protein